VHAAVVELIALNPRITLSEVSAELQIERHTIERACAETSKLSFRELQQQIRFENACALLSEPKPHSIKEVAAALGYSARAFTRFIERNSGCSPTELRARLLGRGKDKTRRKQAPIASTDLPKRSNKKR
jgi:AraC-like DNA-binding protein